MVPATTCMSMSQATQNLSPRRVKAACVTVLFELRAVRSLPPAVLLARLEGKVRTWRGLQRWTLQTYTSARGEAVVQLVAEKPAQSMRVDNAFSSWRRVMVQVLPLHAGGGSGEAAAKAWRRACWISSDAQPTSVCLYADVKLLAEPYEAARAKLWEEARRSDGGAARCSYLEPALPQLERPRQLSAAPAAVGRAVSAASNGAATAVAGRAKAG